MKLYRIVFKYMDAYSHGNWNTQECVCSSLNECIEMYGLNESGVDYVIISKEEVK